ncbi:hypothetical protein D3C84_700480 [compost metagenome]
MKLSECSRVNLYLQGLKICCDFICQFSDVFSGREGATGKLFDRDVYGADVYPRLLEQAPVYERDNKVMQPVWTAGSGHKQGNGGDDSNCEATNAFLPHDHALGEILRAAPFFVFFRFGFGAVGVYPGFSAQGQPTILQVFPGHAVAVVTEDENPGTPEEVDLNPFGIGVMCIFEEFVNRGGNPRDLLPAEHVDGSSSYPELCHEDS